MKIVLDWFQKSVNEFLGGALLIDFYNQYYSRFEETCLYQLIHFSSTLSISYSTI